MTSISLDLFRREQVGAVAAGFFEGLRTAPFGDFGVIAADEDLGNGPATEFGGARVVRKIEKSAICRQSFMQLGGFGLLRSFEQAERLVLRRGFVAQRTTEKASDGVDDEGGGQFAATQDEIADGEFVGGEMLCDTLVHAFVSAADENHAILLREAASSFLGETFSGGREQNDRSF